MLDSMPVHLQVITWPLLGAALILALNRFLPNWIRRLVALAATITTLVAFWILLPADSAAAGIVWDPLNFFRAGPALLSDSATRFFGAVLTAFCAAAVLGIRTTRPRRTVWHGMVLVTLAGCLVMTMAANLLTLTLGSALLDLALLAVAVSDTNSSSHGGRVAWRMAVPGVLSTLVLFACTLQQDIEVGTTSLLIEQIPSTVLMLMGVAGLLRLMIFPLHPRGQNTPESAALLILPTGMGIYLLYRVQAHSPILTGQQWILAIGWVSMLVGGLLAWSGRSRSKGTDVVLPTGPQSSLEPETRQELGPEGPYQPAVVTIWSGIAIHQTAVALTYGVLEGALLPWPLINIAAALGTVAVWWDSQSRDRAVPAQRLWVPVKNWAEPWLSRARAAISTRFSAVGKWPGMRLARYWTALPPTTALASLIGLPATVGAHGRWRLYAMLLSEGRAMLLIGTLAADAFLCAGLWWTLGSVLKEARAQRLLLAPTLATGMLAIATVALGVAPYKLVGDLGSSTAQAATSLDVSVWGVGLLFVLPWLLGSWLARATGPMASRHLQTLRRIVSLDWAFNALSWAAQRLANVVHWLGQVGEGEGWWGWALIVLALGTMLLASL